jgi:NTP pyrophosphatase (non-canonical NTP hydrolase)
MQYDFLAQLQDEVVVWTDYNFPDSPAYRPLLGIVEEMGEFFYARVARDDPATRDAIGDVFVYAAHYCHLKGWSLPTVFAGVSLDLALP